MDKMVIMTQKCLESRFFTVKAGENSGFLDILRCKWMKMAKYQAKLEAFWFGQIRKN